jgi:ribosomal protein S18 acetylase RimI-like enzyme
MKRDRTFRAATVDDASVLAELINYAGEGLPLYLWSRMAEPGEGAWDVGRHRAAREEGSFSYRNATIIEHDGQCAGCLIGYEIPDKPEPIPDDMPAMFVPLQELENLAPGTWYINVLAVRPQFRNQGLGTKLMALAEEKAQRLGKRGMSVIVSDANLGARRIYTRLGYNEMARRLMIKENWEHGGENWILLTKTFKQ